LTAAVFTWPNRVDLTFDRAINIATMNVTSVIVDDSDSGDQFSGSGTPTLLAANQVRVPLTMVGPVSVPNTYLTAGPGTNLAAVNDGGTWPGTTNLELPYS
jgi:hypothetical protein